MTQSQHNQTRTDAAPAGATANSDDGNGALAAAAAPHGFSAFEGWAGVASIAAGTFLLVTTEFLPIGLLTPIAANLGVSEGVAGLAVTGPGFVAALAAPLLTVMADRIDRRLVIIALTAMIVLSSVIGFLAPNFTVFLIGRLVLGLAVGGLWSFAVAVGRRLVPESAGARATSIISLGISAGTVFGMPVGAMAGDWIGWRYVFAINAVFGVVVILLQMRFLPRLAVTQPISLARLGAFARVPMARLGLLASAFVAAGHFIAYTFLEPFLRDGLSFGQNGVALALAGYAITGIAGSFLGEKLAVRNIRVAFAVSSLVLGIAVLAAGINLGSDSPVASMIMVLVWGTAFGAVPVCVQIWMYMSSPALYEAGSALMVSAFQISLAAGAAIGGVLVDHVGLQSAFVVGAVILTVFRAYGAARDSVLSGEQA